MAQLKAGSGRVPGHQRGIEYLASLGDAAKGVVYGMMGLLAIQVAVGAGGQTGGPKQALQAIAGQPFGGMLLGITAAGLAAYAVWRIVQAFVDPERKGSDLKGIVTRTGYFASGVLYACLTFESARMVIGAAGAAGESNEAAHWTARLMQQPFGRYLVGAVGVAILGVGVYQFRRAWDARFLEMLKTRQMSDREVRWSSRLGRVGFAARGLVYLIIGGFLVGAAVKIDPQNAVGIGEALSLLARQPYGPWLLGAVAAGLAAYGVFSAAIMARFRRVFR